MIYPLKLSRKKGNWPRTSLLSFAQLSWNIADGILYAKALDDSGNEIIVPIAGKNYQELSDQEEPKDGREVEIRATETHLQYRYLPDANWINILDLNDIRGTDGREVILSSDDTSILWQHEGDSEWNVLMDKHPTGFENQPTQADPGQYITQVLVSDKGHVIGVVTNETPMVKPFFSSLHIHHPALTEGETMSSPTEFSWEIAYVNNYKPNTLKITDLFTNTILYEDSTGNHHSDGETASSQMVSHDPITHNQPFYNQFKIEGKNLKDETFFIIAYVRWLEEEEPPITKYSLSLDASHSNAVNLIGQGSYEEDKQVNILAEITNPLYEFIEWETINGSPALNNHLNSNTFFNMPSHNVSLKALLKPPKTLSLTSDHGSPSGQGQYAENNNVNIDISIPAGYTFVKWIAISNNINWIESTTKQETFVMPYENVHIHAEVTPPPPKLIYIGASTGNDADNFTTDNLINPVEIPLNAQSINDVHLGELYTVEYTGNKRYFLYMVPASFYQGDVFIRAQNASFPAKLQMISDAFVFNQDTYRVYVSAIRINTPIIRHIEE